MKIICEKQKLLKALLTVSHAITSKSPNPINECAVITIDKDTIIITGINETMAIKTTDVCNVIEEGAIAVNCRLFIEIVNKYPDAMLEVESDMTTLKIKCGNSKSNLHLVTGSFPEFPRAEESEPVYIQEKAIKKLINQTLFSCAVFEDKPILTGLFFEISENKLTLVGLDGYRMAIRNAVLDNYYSDQSIVVPAKSLRELNKILEDTDDLLEIYMNKNFVLFKTENEQLYTKVLEGEYVKYRGIIPMNQETKIKVDKEELKNSIERVSVLTREEINNLIKMTIADDKIILNSNSDLGNADESINIYMEGKDLTIAFNAKYLLEILRVLEEDEITIDFNTPTSPCKIYDKTYKYIVLPVQLRDENVS